jgi:hypothetical protein
MCLENEYAFSVKYNSGVEVRVAHFKGVWTLLRYKEGKATGWFSFDDSGSVVDASDAFVRSFIDAVLERFVEDTKGYGWWNERSMDALLLSKVFGVMGGKDSDVTHISVVQPGRNAILDPKTGEFDLQPSEPEFRK